MTPAEVVDRVGHLLGQPVTCPYGQPVVDVPPPHWTSSARAVRDDPSLALVLFDLLTAVDDAPAGFTVVLRLWSPAGRHGLLLRTALAREQPTVASLAEVFAGADWHERSVHEMFGVRFEGHPGLAPLMLADGPATPMRKDRLLAARVVRPWPGTVEPGQSAAQACPDRPRLRPPGVPEPGRAPDAR